VIVFLQNISVGVHLSLQVSNLSLNSFNTIALEDQIPIGVSLHLTINTIKMIGFSTLQRVVGNLLGPIQYTDKYLKTSNERFER